MPCSFDLCLSDIKRPPPQAAYAERHIFKHSDDALYHPIISDIKYEKHGFLLHEIFVQRAKLFGVRGGGADQRLKTVFCLELEE